MTLKTMYVMHVLLISEYNILFDFSCYKIYIDRNDVNVSGKWPQYV